LRVLPGGFASAVDNVLAETMPSSAAPRPRPMWRWTTSIAAGNLFRLTDAGNNTITYSYDALNPQPSTTDPAAHSVGPPLMGWADWISTTGRLIPWES
jgi:YD repeat-containing protein